MPRVLPLIAFLIASMAGNELTASAQQAAPRKEPQMRGTDVRPIVKEKKFEEGTNLVDTSKEGLKLFGIVKNGKITGWEVSDKTGKKLSVTPKRVRQGTLATVHCWVCVTDPDKGQQVCWQIDCKDLPRPPSTPVIK